MNNCSHKDCNYPVVNKKYNLCTIHNWERLHPGKDYYLEQGNKAKEYSDRMREKELKRPKKIYKSNPKPSKPIRQVSKKQAKIDSEYSKVRKKFIALNPVCKVAGCQCEATEVHHMRGRGRGYWDQWARDNNICLTVDTRWFFPICHDHHRKATDDSKWAMDNGYSLSRLEKNED